ncbi:hypothetical protein F4782DRAFT_398787 [Xylaria castorea]|nr:hypothetical protein F4782DRAFT_398787 [Xylaria castorea]
MSLEKIPVCFVLCVLSTVAVGSHTKQSLTMIFGDLSLSFHFPRRPPVSKGERIGKAWIQLREYTGDLFGDIERRLCQ